MGAGFLLSNRSSQDFTPTYDSLRSGIYFGAYLNVPSTYLNGTFLNDSYSSQDLYKNPFHITQNNFSAIGRFLESKLNKAWWGFDRQHRAIPLVVDLFVC
jgi:hypothetical protein